MGDFVESFSVFVEFFQDLIMPAGVNFIFYSVLKTEGDILMDLREFDFAIKCYKTIKD